MRRRILGLNPGARYLGYALFNNSELRDWGIKAVKGKWSPAKSKKIGRILTGFLNEYQPDAVAIKKLHHARASANLHGLVNRFKDICRERGIPVYEYPIKHIEKVVLTGNLNKRRLSETLAELYPALTPEIEKERKSRNSYHTRMFEAVALGHVCFNQLDN
jgi:Holliday junction resolvasome RuvABC endonuclease subunit